MQYSGTAIRSPLELQTEDSELDFCCAKRLAGRAVVANLFQQVSLINGA